MSVFDGDCIFRITPDGIEAVDMIHGEIWDYEQVSDEHLRELVGALVNIHNNRIQDAALITQEDA